MRSEVKEKLISALKTVSEDKEFILAVVVLVKDAKDRQSMIEYILSDEKPTYEDVLLTAFEIHELRNKE